MRPFNVLAPETDIHHSLLLEASAGTGKTFSIENLVVRLLLEGEEPFLIEEILCVTFTNAAAHDLRTRIRTNIEKALSALSKRDFEGLPYLENLNGEPSIRRLETALFCFDAAQIFTIHSFCLRMLRENLFEGDIGLDAAELEGKVPMAEQRRLVRDFFRTSVQEGLYSPVQIRIVLNNFNFGGDGGTEILEEQLIRTVSRGIPVALGKTFQEQYEMFCRGLQQIAPLFEIEKLREDYLAGAKRLRSGKEDYLDGMEAFLSLIEKRGCTVSEFERLIAKKSGIVPKTLKGQHYPDLKEKIYEPLLKPYEEAGCADMIFSQMAHDCQKLFERYLSEEEKLTFDDIVKTMGRAVKNPAFAERVKARYKAAVVDEFQDTDPEQWEIFRELFGKRRLYLVGDPKQSIYAFRRADIYTYLQAKDYLDCSYSLDTNFRSQAPLIEALNILFSEENAPGLIALPKIEGSLPCQRVKPSYRVCEDGKPPVHLLFAGDEESAQNAARLENEAFFPFICEELVRLNRCEGVSFKNCALLVSSHGQAEALFRALKEAEIPCIRQKSGSIAESQALFSLKDLISAVLNPRDDSAVKTALSTPLIGFSPDEIIELPERALELFYLLRNTLLEKGFAPFFEEMLLSSWHGDGQSASEKLLMREGGLEFWSDLHQAADLLMEHQSKKHAAPDALLAYIDQLRILDIDEDDRLKKRADPDADAVKIMTVHSSKGLEFDYVFAIGLIREKKTPRGIVPDEEGGSALLRGISDKDSPLYLNYCREIGAEKMRQLYVALTRAKYRLYIPAILKKKGSKNPASASPMELFLGCFKNLRNVAESRPDLFSLSFLEIKKEREEALVPMEELPELLPPVNLAVLGGPYYMQSFTSLSKGHGRSELLMPAPQDFHNREKTPHTLPAGSETGNMLHLLFENLSFQCQDVPSYVEKMLKNSRYAPWGECLAAMVEDALRAPLDGFCLRDVADEACFKETEFIYPFKEGSLKGVIDLMFFHNGKYYLLDWKSNWLGPSAEAYSRENLKKAMEANQYHLQAELYEEALSRYLRLFDQKPFEEVFGGTFYLFVRGLEKPPCGVYLAGGAYELC